MFVYLLRVSPFVPNNNGPRAHGRGAVGRLTTNKRNVKRARRVQVADVAGAVRAHLGGGGGGEGASAVTRHRRNNSAEGRLSLSRQLTLNRIIRPDSVRPRANGIIRTYIYIRT